MATLRPIAMLATALLAVATLVTPAVADSDQLKLKVEWDGNKTDPDKRLKVKLHNGNDVDPKKSYDRCTKADVWAKKCREGYPVDTTGNEVLGTITQAPDEIVILTDVTNPGSSCVCYGNRCYCN